MAAASAVFVVALSLALFAVLEPTLGAAGAAAAVAAACLLILVVAGLTLLIFAGSKRGRPPVDGERDVGSDLLELARRRPIFALFGALVATAAGVTALRNPRLAAGIFSSLLGARRPR
ncbi:MAG: hypothetical protein ACOYKF_05325 [Phenylobacterium sp.]